jgi:hypothetical protein
VSRKGGISLPAGASIDKRQRYIEVALLTRVRGSTHGLPLLVQHGASNASVGLPICECRSASSPHDCEESLSANGTPQLAEAGFPSFEGQQPFANYGSVPDLASPDGPAQGFGSLLNPNIQSGQLQRNIPGHLSGGCTAEVFSGAPLDSARLKVAGELQGRIGDAINHPALRANVLNAGVVHIYRERNRKVVANTIQPLDEENAKLNCGMHSSRGDATSSTHELGTDAIYSYRAL